MLLFFVFLWKFARQPNYSVATFQRSAGVASADASQIHAAHFFTSEQHQDKKDVAYTLKFMGYMHIHNTWYDLIGPLHPRPALLDLLSPAAAGCHTHLCCWPAWCSHPSAFCPQLLDSRPEPKSLSPSGTSPGWTPGGSASSRRKFQNSRQLRESQKRQRPVYCLTALVKNYWLMGCNGFLKFPCSRQGSCMWSVLVPQFIGQWTIAWHWINYAL